MLSNVLKFLRRPDLEAMCPRSLFRHQVPCWCFCHLWALLHCRWQSFSFWCLTPQGALNAMMGCFWTGAANFSDYTRPGCERWEGRENFPMGRKSAWLSVDKIIASCAKGFCRKNFVRLSRNWIQLSTADATSYILFIITIIIISILL